jgi:glycosyltransferase involved in cell wall biosynthesis
MIRNTNANIEFVGEIDERRKANFLGNALALLFPIDWPEPFGVVMIEAMACGTPVIAFDCGSVREVVRDGVSGRVVRTMNEAIAAVHGIASLDRRRVRAAFDQGFTARRMALDYVSVYRNLIARDNAARSEDLKPAAPVVRATRELSN